MLFTKSLAIEKALQQKSKNYFYIVNSKQEIAILFDKNKNRFISAILGSDYYDLNTHSYMLDNLINHFNCDCVWDYKLLDNKSLFFPLFMPWFVKIEYKTSKSFKELMKNTTPTELSKHTGISRQQIYQYMKENCKPSEIRCSLLNSYFKCNVIF